MINIDIVKNAELSQLGELPKVNKKMNAEMNSLLELSPRVDFLADAETSLDVLELQGVIANMFETEDDRHICLFAFNEETYITQPYRMKAHAAAVALHFVLVEISQR